MTGFFTHLQDMCWQHISKRAGFLGTLLRRRRNAEEYHVILPHHVHLPHPASGMEQIRIPASINGIDMSTGRL